MNVTFPPTDKVFVENFCSLIETVNFSTHMSVELSPMRLFFRLLSLSPPENIDDRQR